MQIHVVDLFFRLLEVHFVTFFFCYIHDRWRVGPPPCLHCSFVVAVVVLVLSNCNSSDIGQLPVPIVAFRTFDENNRTDIVVIVVVGEVVVLVVVVVVV